MEGQNKYSQHYINWKNADLDKIQKELEDAKKQRDEIKKDYEAKIEEKKQERKRLEEMGKNRIEINQSVTILKREEDELKLKLKHAKDDIIRLEEKIDRIKIVQNEEQSKKKINKLIDYINEYWDVENKPDKYFDKVNELRKYLGAFVYDYQEKRERPSIMFIKDLYEWFGLEFLKKNGRDEILKLQESFTKNIEDKRNELESEWHSQNPGEILDYENQAEIRKTAEEYAKYKLKEDIERGVTKEDTEQKIENYTFEFDKGKGYSQEFIDNIKEAGFKIHSVTPKEIHFEKDGYIFRILDTGKDELKIGFIKTVEGKTPSDYTEIDADSGIRRGVRYANNNNLIPIKELSNKVINDLKTWINDLKSIEKEETETEQKIENYTFEFDKGKGKEFIDNIIEAGFKIHSVTEELPPNQIYLKRDGYIFEILDTGKEELKISFIETVEGKTRYDYPEIDSATFTGYKYADSIKELSNKVIKILKTCINDLKSTEKEETRPHKFFGITYYEKDKDKWEVPYDPTHNIEYGEFDSEKEARDYITKQFESESSTLEEYNDEDEDEETQTETHEEPPKPEKSKQEILKEDIQKNHRVISKSHPKLSPGAIKELKSIFDSENKSNEEKWIEHLILEIVRDKGADQPSYFAKKLLAHSDLSAEDKRELENKFFEKAKYYVLNAFFRLPHKEVKEWVSNYENPRQKMQKSKNQYEKNRQIEEFIDTKGDNLYNEEEVKFIAEYTGYGGLQKYMTKEEAQEQQSLLYEFYTPDKVVKKMWGLAYQYGFDGSGYVLEPSCGIGHFIKYAPTKEKVKAYEINKYAAKISRIFYPNATIFNAPFETEFRKDTGAGMLELDKDYNGKYDLVISNFPFGEYANEYSATEKDISGATTFDAHFIYRSLDALKYDGLIVCIVSSNFMKNKHDKVKENINKRASLLDAYRLPTGIFQNTDITTDLLVIKKEK